MSLCPTIRASCKTLSFWARRVMAAQEAVALVVVAVVLHVVHTPLALVV